MLVLSLVLQIINADSTCRRCGNGMVTDNVTGERFCGKCGYVLSEILEDSGPEWRSFSKEEHEEPLWDMKLWNWDP